MAADAQPTSLSRLLASGRRADAVVSFGAAGERRWRDFTAHVANLTHALRAAGGGDWLLYSEDSYAFAVALLACAHAGCTAILPPNRQAGTLRRLAGLATGAVVDPGQEIAAPKPGRLLHPLTASGGTALRGGEVSGDAVVARFFTSGTTGEGTSVIKRLRHLDTELAVLESQFGPALGAAARVHATVSHQHIYGALFRVLWPLVAARPFSSDTLLHSEEILPRLASGPAALVTTPVHLRTMVESGACRGLPPHLPIFTSGGPLDATTAASVSDAVGEAAFEILGSTETGGVAWRRRPHGGETAWQPFAEVEVEADAIDGRLVVTSPFVSTGEVVAGDPHRARFTMGDLVDFVDGGFLLRGRADRVVKIGARRLSLAEMEGCLVSHPFIAEAALLAMRRGGEVRVCAAVVLSSSGRAALADRGRRALRAALCDHLAAYWDRALLPRAWRYVDALPRNSLGKLTAEALRRLFEPAPAVLAPLLLAEQSSETTWEGRLRVPADLSFLAGHFPSRPVVAGVVQLRWVIEFAARTLAGAAEPEAIEALKFKNPLLPNDEFSLAIAVERNKVRFRLWNGEREFCSGRLVLKDSPPG